MTSSATSGRSRRRATAIALSAVALAMVGLSFASVPLYRLFCQVTGFGGTPLQARAAPAAAPLDRVVTVRFNADVAPGLGWQFEPVLRDVAVRVGEQTLAFYRARNLSAHDTVGTASFNVTPLKTGAHFVKVECFCFTEQRLGPGEEAMLPVSFFIDPAFATDRAMDGLEAITLSYTFFRAIASDPAPAKAARAATN